MHTLSWSHKFHAREVAMIFGMDEWTNSDTDTEKENETAKQWLSWVAIDLNQVAAIVAVSVAYHTVREVLARKTSGCADWWQYSTTLSVQYALNQLTFGNMNIASTRPQCNNTAQVQ